MRDWIFIASLMIGLSLLTAVCMAILAVPFVAIVWIFCEMDGGGGGSGDPWPWWAWFVLWCLLLLPSLGWRRVATTNPCEPREGTR